MTEKINKTINDLIDAIENLLKTQNKYVFYGILAMVFIAGLSIGFDHLKFNRWFDKKMEKTKSTTIYYDALDERTVSAEFRFRAYLGNDPMNYFATRCPQIEKGIVFFEFDKKIQEEACFKAGFPIKLK